MNFRIVIAVILISLVFSSTIQSTSWAQNPNIRVEDPSFGPQDFRTAETLSNTLVPVIIESFGAALIIVFIVIYTVKKRREKDDSS